MKDLVDSINTLMKEPIVRRGASDHPSDVPYRLSTGSLLLDLALSGGVAGGKTTEIYGREGVGKSTMALHLMRSMQEFGGSIFYADTEYTFDKKRAEAFGVDLRSVAVANPSSFAELFSVILTYLGSLTDPSLVVIDSLAFTPEGGVKLFQQAKKSALKKAGVRVSKKGMPSEKGIENILEEGEEVIVVPSGVTSEDGMGRHAIIIKKGLKQVTGILGVKKSSLVILNQVYQDVGNTFFKADVVYGGLGPKYASSQRISLRAETPFQEAGDVPGRIVQATVSKSRVGRPYGSCRFPLMSDRGIDQKLEAFYYLLESPVTKVVTREGAWYYLHGFEEKPMPIQKKEIRKKFSDPILFGYVKRKVEEDWKMRCDLGLDMVAGKKVKEASKSE